MAYPQEKFNQDNAAEQTPDLTREYVVGTNAWGSRIGQVLSNFIDDVEYIVGADVYERMSRDPTVSKNLQFQKLSVVSEGVQLHPAISNKEDAEYQLAVEIRDFHLRSLKGLHRPISQIIGEMMTAQKRGHSVAEVTYKEPVSGGIDSLKLMLRSIKVKPRNTTAFVIDEFRNVLGLTAWLWGNRGVVERKDIADTTKLVPLEKFAILAFETEDEDPRGIISLRPGYNFWQAKNLVPGLHLKWLEKSGVPSTIGFTAQDSGDGNFNQGNNSDGNLQTAQEAMADKLAQLESGASAAFPFGAKVEKVEVAGNGAQFTRAYGDFDQQIDYALSLQSGATKDSQKGTYGAKRVMKDVLDILIWSRKQAVAQVLQGVIDNGTRYNFGEDKVHLSPKVMIGDEEGRDWAADAHSLAELGPMLTNSQWLFMCSELGIPAPEQDEELPNRVKAAPSPQSQDPNATDQPPGQTTEQRGANQ